MYLLSADSASPRKGLEQSVYASKAKGEPETWVCERGKLLSKIFSSQTLGQELK